MILWSAYSCELFRRNIFSASTLLEMLVISFLPQGLYPQHNTLYHSHIWPHRMVQRLSMHAVLSQFRLSLVRWTNGLFSEPLDDSPHGLLSVCPQFVLLVYHMAVFQGSVIHPYIFSRLEVSRRKQPEPCMTICIPWFIHHYSQGTTFHNRKLVSSTWFRRPRHVWLHKGIEIIRHFLYNHLSL